MPKFTLSSPTLRARLLAISLLAALAPITASASVLMLNFGPTVATGSNLTNSPYHSVNQTFTDTYWNNVQLANISSGLFYSDQSAASGISVTLGSSVGSSLVNFATRPTNSSALGSNTHIVNPPGSVFSGTSVGTGAIFTSAPAGQNLVGLKIGGLSAGRYEIYVIGANTNNGLGTQSPAAFYAAAAGDAVSFETAGRTPDATTLLTAASVVNWTEGGSYGKITLDLAEGQYLLLATEGLSALGGSESRGFLNAVQIVAIPEPSAIAFGFAGLLLLPLCRRIARAGK